MPTARPPEIDSGNRQPEKREVASTGDGARGDTAFVLRAEPAVPIDDVVKPVMQFRFRAEDHSGIWIHVGCAFTTEADGDGCGRFVAQDHACGLGFGILRARLGYQFIQAYALRIGTRRHDLAHVSFGVFDQLVLVHEDDAGRRHDEDDGAADNAGEQVRPKNDFMQQLHAVSSGASSSCRPSEHQARRAASRARYPFRSVDGLLSGKRCGVGN